MSKDDFDFGKDSTKDKPKSGMSTGAIVGIVIGVLLLCSCLGCGGCCAFQWDDFKKGFDEGFKKAQQKK
jgi:hypothetical protein